jgi:hypothetical protein
MAVPLKVVPLRPKKRGLGKLMRATRFANDVRYQCADYLKRPTAYSRAEITAMIRYLKRRANQALGNRPDPDDY